MIIRAAVVMLLSVPALSAGQSLGEIARQTEESRKASANAALKFDQRDVDPRMQDPDLMEYRLDKERWDRLVAADVWTTQAMERNPALYERVTGGRVQSLRAFERLLTREPEMQAALKSAGCDPHDFAYSTGALMVSMVLIQKELTAEQVAMLPEAFRANLEFVRGRMAELQGMMARANQLKARMESAAKR